MDFFKYTPFISDMTEHLAWPLSAAFAAWLAFKLLCDKLPKVTRMNFKGFEFEAYVPSHPTQDKTSNSEGPSSTDQVNKELGKYLKGLENDSKNNKFHAVQNGLMLVKNRTKIISDYKQIKYVGLLESLDEIVKSNAIDERLAKQITKLESMFQKILNYNDLDSVPSNVFQNYLYGCAVTAVSLDMIIDELERNKK